MKNPENSRKNQQLLRDIAFGHLIRDDESKEMAKDLMLMTLSDCCLTRRLTSWEDIYLDAVNKFQNYCADAIPDEYERFRDEWYEMAVEDQVDLILGQQSWSNTDLACCSCSCSEE